MIDQNAGGFRAAPFYGLPEGMEAHLIFSRIYDGTKTGNIFENSGRGGPAECQHEDDQPLDSQKRASGSQDFRRCSHT